MPRPKDLTPKTRVRNGFEHRVKFDDSRPFLTPTPDAEAVEQMRYWRSRYEGWYGLTASAKQ